MPSQPPPSYNSSALISPQVDGWMRGDAPSTSVEAREQNYLLQKAKAQLSNAAPTLTAHALEKAFQSRLCDDWFFLTEMTRASGFLSLPFAIIGDILKAPVRLTQAAIIGTVGAIGNRSQKQKFQQKLITIFLDSFLSRFEATLMILIHMGVETPQSLHQQFKDGKLDHFLTLTLFFTAFASRHASDGYIFLASGQKVSRNQCPAIGLHLFDQIHKLKVEIILMALPKTTPKAAALVKKWVPGILKSLQDPESVAENQNLRLAPLMKQLHLIQKQIKALPLDQSVVATYNDTPIRIAQQSA